MSLYLSGDIDKGRAENENRAYSGLSAALRILEESGRIMKGEGNE